MFSHIESGRARMVDISDKEDVVRIATAEGFIRLKKETLEAVLENKVVKGNVLAVANTAAVLAVKKTPELIPMCHPIPITSIQVCFDIKSGGIKAECTVKSVSKTGVEMEALTGVSVALLTIWDMVKSIEKVDGQYSTTAIEDIKVVRKVKS